MAKYMGVEQTTSRASMGGISPAPVMRSPDVGGEVVKQIVGIGSQLISQGMKDAGNRRIGKKALEITEALQSSLDLSVVERDRKLTSMLRDGIESGDIRYQDLPAIRAGVARTETTRITLPDGTTVNKAKDGTIIAPRQPTAEGKVANRMVENGTKIELAFPKATRVFQDMIGTKMPNALDNAPVIEAATNLTSFFETVDNQTLIAQTGMTEESYKMELQNRGSMFKTLLSKLESEVASVAVAQKLGAGDGDINMNAPQLAMKAFYDDLRVQMTPQRLRALGLSPDAVEKMASDSLSTMRTFAEDATKMGAVNAVARMRDRVSVTMELNILKGQKRALAGLSPATRMLLDRSGFLQKIASGLSYLRSAGYAPDDQLSIGKTVVDAITAEPFIMGNAAMIRQTINSTDPNTINRHLQHLASADRFAPMFATGEFNAELDLHIEAGERILKMHKDGSLPKTSDQNIRDLTKRLETLKNIRKNVVK